MTDAPSTNLPGCPPWCKSQAGHPYESETHDGVLLRYHEAPNVAGVVAEHRPMAPVRDHNIRTGTSCEEQAVSGRGPDVQAAPVIILWTENPVLTATEARALAAMLVREADRLESLIGDAA